MPTQTRLDELPTKNEETENLGATKQSQPNIMTTTNKKRNALTDLSNINSNNSNNRRNSNKTVVYIRNSVKINKISQITGNESKKLDKKKNSNENQLKNIENIDEFYKQKLFLAPDYAEDIYEYLRNLEIKFKIRKWPLNNVVSEEMRATLIDWLIEVHIEYELLQETLHLAVSIVDRFLQKSNNVTVKNFQLIGICSLSIAVKFEEVQPLSINDFLYLCNNAYEKCEFLDMEVDILNMIEFKIARPLSITFLRRYSLAGRAERRQHIYAKYIIDLLLLEAKFCHLRPSLIAACAYFIATCLYFGNLLESYWSDQLVYYSKYKYENLQPFIARICYLILHTNSNWQSVKKKYSFKEFEFVSNRILLKSPILKSLCQIKPHG